MVAPMASMFRHLILQHNYLNLVMMMSTDYESVVNLLLFNNKILQYHYGNMELY